MKRSKIYVDICILSRIIDLKFDDLTGIAIDKLCDMDELEMVTSSKTLEEFLNTTENKRKTALKLIFKIISKLQKKESLIYNPATWGSNMWGTSSWGEGSTSEDPLFTKIKNIFDPDDSYHIYQACKNNCKYFLTFDKKTILNRAKANQIELKKIPLSIKFVDPIELIKDLSK